MTFEWRVRRGDCGDSVELDLPEGLQQMPESVLRRIENHANIP